MQRKAESNLMTGYGKFRLIVYEDDNRQNHIALVNGDVSGKENVLVRVHSECITGEAFRSKKCDCGEQLDKALSIIGKEGGVLVYLRQEGRGIGLINKIKAYALQEQGMDTVEANERLGFKADARDYTIGVKILADLGLSSIRLLTNNPKKIEGLEKYGIRIVERIPLIVEPSKENAAYLKAKKEKLGHYLEECGFV
jgi:3,4-dihydroxy 2-butanone 4-phosphate synthase/GTP cyclohydrolase II